MKARKILAALGAALLIISISAPASAFDCEGNGNLFDPMTIAMNLGALAIDIRCINDSAKNPGRWDGLNPVFEKRAAPSCDVHNRLARSLFEKREFADDSKPRKNQNNDASGAAWDVRNGKYEGAISKLDSFITAALKSRLNRSYDPDEAAAQLQRRKWINEAEKARICVNQLLLP